MAMVEAATAPYSDQVVWVDIKASEIEGEACEMTGINTLRPVEISTIQDNDPLLQKVKAHLAQQVKPSKSQLKREHVKLKAWLRDWDRLQVGSDGVLRRS